MYNDSLRTPWISPYPAYHCRSETCLCSGQTIFSNRPCWSGVYPLSESAVTVAITFRYGRFDQSRLPVVRWADSIWRVLPEKKRSCSEYQLLDSKTCFYDLILQSWLDLDNKRHIPLYCADSTNSRPQPEHPQLARNGRSDLFSGATMHLTNYWWRFLMLLRSS